jgi:hypothetical protein
MLKRFDYRVRDQLLGNVEVAEKADQARGQPARLLAEDAFEQRVRLSGDGQ